MPTWRGKRGCTGCGLEVAAGRASRRHRLACLAASSVAVALIAAVVPAAGSSASGVRLRTVLATWSKRVSVDARTVSLAARQRHPVAMAHSALRFRTDALHARAALAAVHAATPRQRRARQLAVQAFSHYATAGSRWAASGRARRHGLKREAIAAARAAAASARAGGKLLAAAGRLV